jgi:hypothetical protein
MSDVGATPIREGDAVPQAEGKKLSLADKLASMNANPKFQVLPYEKQSAMRQYVLSQLPEYAALPVDAQVRTMNLIADAPPAYADPAFKAKQAELLADPTQSAAYRESMKFNQSSITGRASAWLALQANKGPHLFDKPLDDVQVKSLQGDPDAKKLVDYLALKQGVSIPMAEGVRKLLGKVPVIGVLASPDLAQALGDLVGTTADIAGTGLVTGGALSVPGAAAKSAVSGALVKGGAGAAAQAVLPAAAKIAAGAATSGAFGVAREAVVDPQAVSNAQGISGTFFGWAVADAVFGGLHEATSAAKVYTRGRAALESVGGKYPRILKENAGAGAAEQLATKTLKSSDPDFAVQPEGVKDMVLAREQIAAAKAADPQALTSNPVARLQAQAMVGPLERRGLDISVVPNGDGTFRVRELPDAGGEIATVRNPQRGAQEKPLAEVTLAEATKEVARRYDAAVISADARLAAERANLDKRKGIAEKQAFRGLEMETPSGEKYHTMGILPLQEPPRSVELSPSATANWRALQEAKRSYASALIDRKALDDFQGSDVATVRTSILAIRKVLEGPEDALAMNARAAISEGERQHLQGVEGVKTIDFAQVVKPEELRRIGARGTFLDTDNPISVKPASGSESNAVGVYSRPLNDVQFSQLTQVAQVLKAKQELPVDPLDLARTLAMQVGADAIEHQDGSVTLLYPKEQAKHVTDFIDPKSGRYYEPKFVKKGVVEEGEPDVRAVNSLAGTVRISQSVKQTFPNITEPKVMTEFLAQKTLGELQANNIDLLVRTALAELDLPTEKVRVARVEREPGDMSVALRHSEGTTTVAVPKKVNGVLEQQAFLKNFTDALTEASKDYHGARAAEARMARGEETLGPVSPQKRALLLEAMKREIKSEMMVSAAGVNPAREAVANNVYKAPTGADANQTLAWLTDAMMKSKGFGLTPVGGKSLADGTFSLAIPGKDPFVGTLPSVVDEFLLQNTSEGALRHDLALKGYDLKKHGGQTWVEDRHGKVLGGKYFDDHVTLMRELGLRPDKIDGRFGPDSIEVGDPDVTFNYQGGKVSASLQEAMKFAAKFADMSAHDVQEIVLRQKEGTVSRSKVSSQYVVDMKELGVHKTFKSGAAAYKYLRGEVYDIHNLLIDAENKGFVAYREEGKYVVSSPEGRHLVDTREEVRKVLSTVPDAEWAPNLLGPYDKPTLDSSLAPGNSVFVQPRVNWAAGALKYARGTISNLFRPAQPRVEALAAQYKMPEVSKALADLRTNIKLAEHQMTLFANATGAAMGTDMPLLQRARLMEYMEASRQDVKTRILKDLFGQDTSTPAAKAFDAKAARLREILGTTPTSGAFAQLGLPAEKFEVNWMPRLQKMLAERPQDVERYNAMPDGAAALMRELYGGNVPKNVNFISQHMRVSDFVDLARETDSARALVSYYKQGFFWLHAGPSMEKFYNLTQGAGVPDALARRADHFIKASLGAVKNDFTAISKAMAREYGLISPEAGDFTNYVLNMGTSNIFLFKPWSAMRQVPDAYMAAAPLLGGNEILDRGFASVRKDMRGALQEGIDKRILSERLPTMEPTASASKFLSKYFAKAHELVQQGDVIPRMAVYRAAGFQFEEGMKKLSENPALTPEKALYAWPYLHDGVRMQVQQAIASGDFVTAKHLYGADLSEQTSGSFRPEDQGMMRNSFGFIGRAWGQLMSMPMQMNDLRYRVLTKGTAAQKVLTTSVMTKNVAAVAMGLNAAGIDGSSFLPWNDLTISGGPVFNLLLDIITSSGNNTQARDQAIRDLEKTLPTRLIPFGGLVQRAIRTVEFARQGELWKAMLATTGTPIARGNLLRGASGQGYFKK